MGLRRVRLPDFGSDLQGFGRRLASSGLPESLSSIVDFEILTVTRVKIKFRDRHAMPRL